MSGGGSYSSSSSGPYQGGLQTDFGTNTTFTKRRASMYGQSRPDANYATGNSSDADVNEAQRLTNESADVNNVGVDHMANLAKINMLKGRIGIKNSLAEQIANQDNMLKGAKDQISHAATDALSSGVKNTRQNYNNRGLLYSGMRESGEQNVRGAVAAEYAGGIAGAERESYNAGNAAKSAYAQVGLASQQQALDQSKRAFETSSANNIARLQAMQQLGSGVGYAGGVMAGRSRAPSSNQGTFGSDYYGEGNNDPTSAPQQGRNTAI